MTKDDIQAFADALSDPVFVVTADSGEIVVANLAALALFETRPTSLLGSRFAQVVGDKDLFDRLLQVFRTSRQPLPASVNLGGKAWHLNGSLLSPGADGEAGLVLLRAMPQKDANTPFRALNSQIAELNAEITRRRRAEDLLNGQNRVLEIIARGEQLGSALEEIARTVEAQSANGALCSVLLVDRTGKHLRHGAAPSLPESYCRAIDGVEIGENVGSCGTAAFRRAAVVVEDIATDPLWQDYKDIALSAGLRACWSTPIMSAGGNILGTLALYYREPQQPSNYDWQIVAVATRTASIAIEQHHAMESLLMQSQVLNSMVEGVSLRNENGVIVYTNPAQDRILGYRRGELAGTCIGGNSADFPEQKNGYSPDIYNQLATTGTWSGELHQRRKDGTPIVLRARISAIRIDGRRYWVAVKEDISEQKRAQEAQRRAEAALIQSEKLAAAGRLAATIAHELNNPLEAVTNLLYLAKSAPCMPSEVRGYLETADSELQRAVHIARQTLGFYKDTSFPVEMQLGNLLDDVLGLYTRRLISRHITIKRDYRASAIVHGFRGEMRQVLSNLVANAIDACNTGGEITVRIRSSFAASASSYRVTVADTGPGVPQVLRHRIFEAFFTTKKDVGTGLGLWVSKQIVGKHGGRIQVRNRPAGGAVFSVIVGSSSVAISEPSKLQATGTQ